MSELVKYETQSGLTFRQQVTYAQEYSKVVDTDDDLLSNIINISLGKSLQLTGFKFEDEKDYDFLLAEMFKEIKSHAKGMRIGEISIAFDRGIKKVYGEWVGLSVVTFTGFIHSFLKDPEYLEIKKSLEPERKEIAPIPYDGTKRLEELKKEFKEKGWAEDTGNIVYDWLMETGVFPERYGSGFYLEAKEQLKKENKKKLITELNGFIRHSLNKTLQEIENNQSNQTIVLAKKLALNAYLKEQLK